MSSSKLLRITLQKEKASIFLYFCACSSVILFYYFLYDSRTIIYPIEMSTFFLLIYLIYRYFIYKKLYMFLEDSKTSPNYQRAKNSEFEDIFNEINSIHYGYISKIYRIENKEKEKEKLLMEWIHNMKTSVSVINLAIEKLPQEEAVVDIKEENVLLEKNLNGVLNIFRLNQFDKDYVPESLNLNSLVKEAINLQKRNFIYSNIFPQINIPKDYFILSDKKWSRYVLVQIISNAIKYSNKGGKVLFYAEKSDGKIILSIKDSGIGIKEDEIIRIFDAFFTGTNGRTKEKSSGIGLYMCKNICEKLNEKIDIKSKVSEGTTVSITYMENRNLSTM